MKIKCPHCNGKGFSELNSAVNMTCGWCMGQGKLDLEIVPTEPLTEQEYLQTCTTEQLAEAIYGFVWCCNELWQRLCCSGDGTDKESDLKIVREWLKQPHTFE